MPLVFRKGSFGTGGPTRVRPNPMTATPRPLVDTALYIGLEDGSNWLVTEDTSDALVLE
jgi:hypothetical protein